MTVCRSIESDGGNFRSEKIDGGIIGVFFVEAQSERKDIYQINCFVLVAWF